MWNYRVVRKKRVCVDPTDGKERVDYTYAIYEAYYDNNGYVGAVTQDLSFYRNADVGGTHQQDLLRLSRIPKTG
jgi:hypothetical protein